MKEVSESEIFPPVSETDSGRKVSRVLRRIFGDKKDKPDPVIESIRAKETRRLDIIQELQRKCPDEPYASIDVVAYERVDLEELCQKLDRLPLQGATREELKALGLGLYSDHYDGRIFRPVVFPRGWTMSPATPEPEISQSGHAYVMDASGEKRAFVVYRIEPDTGFPSSRSYTRIISDSQTENS